MAIFNYQQANFRERRRNVYILDKTHTIRVTFHLVREYLRGLVTVLRSSPIRYMLTLRRGREKERKREGGGEEQEPKVWANVRPISEPRRIVGWSCSETRAACLKYIRELGLIGCTVTKSPKNSLARMTTAHFFLFSASSSHLHLTRVLTSRFIALSFVLRPLPTDFRHPPSNGRPPLRNRVARTRWLSFSFEEAGQRNGIGRRAMDDHDRYG